MTGLKKKLSIGVAFLAPLLAAGPATATDRVVSLIIDASGSMAAEMAKDQTRLDAAKGAVGTLLAGLEKTTRVEIIAYGHQSDRAEKNCKDIARLAPLSALSDGETAAVSAVNGLAARGYTPITDALTFSADGIAGQGEAPVLILVSDGAETCGGDPCAAAAALAKANASLTIHAIGLAADAKTRTQLQCVAERGRGQYFEAADAKALAAALTTAVETGPTKTTEATFTGPGAIAVKAPGGAGLYDGYDVTNSETGAKVGFISGDKTLRLPGGVYTVSIGDQKWVGVSVKAGATTVLEPGVVTVTPDDGIDTPEARDVETRERVAWLEASRGTRAVVLPGRYDIAFCNGTLLVPVEVKAGEKKTVSAARIELSGGFDGFISLLDAEGVKVCEFFDGFAQTGPRRTVPPGQYTLDYAGQKLDFEVKAGEVKVIKLK